MIQALRDLQASTGATFAATATDPLDQPPLSFGNDAAALEAAQTGIAVCDRTHWGRIAILGDDRLRFLHNQTTNAFQLLKPGQGCDTVFVTATARTLDLATAYVLEDSVLLLVSPGYSQKLIQWMDRYIFFADKVELKEMTAATATFSLLGAGSDQQVKQWGAGELIGQPDATHQQVDLDGINLRIAVGSGLATPGYTLIVESNDAAKLWKTLTLSGAIPLGDRLWEQLRIQQGRPAPGQELTEDVNPLEAGLWQTISLSKGCYIGQETIARLHTYKGVKQQLWGIRLSQPAAPDTAITVGEEKVGTLTSAIATDQGYFGLAYIRTKAIAPDLKLQVGEAVGELVALPYISHDYP
ncbi:MAG TPA: folate-binding protein [Coleofasciculaceae cyanobacterium]